MNRTELVARVGASGAELSPEQAVQAVMAAIIDALRAGDSVRVRNFGTFYVGTRPAQRIGLRSMSSLPSVQVVRFRSSQALKRALRS